MKKILVIDSDKKILDIIRKYIESKELIIFTADSAQQAINTADQQRPDIVILELAIPDQNGIAFLHEFRSYPDWINIPVIIHSSVPKNINASEKTWKVLGVVDYLYKPTTSLRKLKDCVLTNL